MNISDLISNQMSSVIKPDQDLSKTDKAVEARKIQAAKDFESVLIQKLLDTVKESVGSFGFEEDSASKQVQGIFWMHLSKEISDQGGFGMWKDIYKSFDELDMNENSNLLDENT